MSSANEPARQTKEDEAPRRGCPDEKNRTAKVRMTRGRGDRRRYGGGLAAAASLPDTTPLLSWRG
jgi:hypothetical protein